MTRFCGSITAYASGANRTADILGLIASETPIGANVSKLSESAIQALTKSKQPIFLDSGAFSEVSVRRGKLTVTNPIREWDWQRRLDIYLRIATVKCCGRNPQLPSQVTVVAPDRVGSQEETLRRLSRFRTELGAIRRAGADVVVPLQIGKRAMMDFYQEASSILSTSIVPGVPMNKAARQLGDILLFISRTRPWRIHCLGIGITNRIARNLLDETTRLSPSIHISLDSNRIRASVGRQRPITILEQEFREELVEGWSGEIDLTRWGDGVCDMTELLCQPSEWLRDVSDLDEFASSLSWLRPEQQQMFASNPDHFVASAETDDWLFQSLAEQYLKYLQRKVRPAARGHAVAETFRLKAKKCSPRDGDVAANSTARAARSLIPGSMK